MDIKASATITIWDVVDIDSITWYYLLQASTSATPAKPTTATPSGWSTTEPSYTAGSTNTLYTTCKTTYSDGTFEYSVVSKSSSYEASKTAYNKAVDASNTANTKSTVYYKAKPAPTGGSYKVNDIWFDTDDGNKMYYWNGSAWTATQFGTSAIVANAIKVAQIDASAVTAGKIATGAVTADKILANAVTADKILAGAITAGKIATDAIVAGNIKANAVTADKILAGSISTTKLATDAVTADKILAGTITATELNVSNVTAAVAKVIDLDASRITSGKITADQINVANLFSKSITATNMNIKGTSTFEGKIVAKSGTIGGLTVTDEELYTEYTANKIPLATGQYGDSYFDHTFTGYTEDGYGIHELRTGTFRVWFVRGGYGWITETDNTDLIIGGNQFDFYASVNDVDGEKKEIRKYFDLNGNVGIFLSNYGMLWLIKHDLPSLSGCTETFTFNTRMDGTGKNVYLYQEYNEGDFVFPSIKSIINASRKYDTLGIDGSSQCLRISGNKFQIGDKIAYNVSENALNLSTDNLEIVTNGDTYGMNIYAKEDDDGDALYSIFKTDVFNKRSNLLGINIPNLTTTYIKSNQIDVNGNVTAQKLSSNYGVIITDINGNDTFDSAELRRAGSTNAQGVSLVLYKSGTAKSYMDIADVNGNFMPKIYNTMLPTVNNSYDLGSDTARFKGVFTRYLSIGLSNYASVEGGINCKWKDNAFHYIVYRDPNGLTANFGFIGSSTYQSVSRLQGYTVNLKGNGGGVHTSSAVVNDSDIRSKCEIKDICDDSILEDLFMSIKPKTFRYKDGFDENSGKIHFGIIADDFIENLTANGLKYTDFAAINEEEQRTVTLEDGTEQIYQNFKSIGYSEFTLWNTDMIQKAHRKIKQLEQLVEEQGKQLNLLQSKYA